MHDRFDDPDTVSVRYIVNDVKSSVRFYVDLLGFEIVMNPPSGFAMLSKGNLRLLLERTRRWWSRSVNARWNCPCSGGMQPHATADA